MSLKDTALSLPIVNILTVVSSLAFAILGLAAYRIASPSERSTFRQIGGLQIVNTWAFFSKRYDFLWSHFRTSSDPHFKFQILQHQIVALCGEEARKVFFETKSLDISEGYKLFVGAAPRLKDISVQTVPGDGSWFTKLIVAVLNKDMLSDVLPSFFSDINRLTERWGKTGRFDPFKNIYDLVFQITVRMVSCSELADDLEAMEKIKSQYWILEKSATLITLLLPWFPSPPKKKKAAATRELFKTLYSFVEKRRAAKVPTSETIDILISRGLSTENIVQFILTVIFAGLINTGINSCWAIVFLASYPEWKAKAKAEVSDFVERHTSSLSSEPLYKRLAAIPVPAWEDEMPILDSVLRETIRLTLSTTALRRNISETLTVSDGIINKGDFVAYSIADAHLNPEIYTQPHEFDPARFGPGREEDKKGTFSYLGWGAGRHPCTGVKVAKLEMKVIIAMIVAGYDFDVVDKNGKHLDNLPKPDRNDLHQARPVGEPCYIEFERTVE